MKRIFVTSLFFLSRLLSADAQLASELSSVEETSFARYVDPKIGSEGLGRVFVGPSMPFGMVKPGPDCTCKPNSGWAPMPEVVTGFSQTHVSGTGGGQKYGNILIQPFIGELSGTVHEQKRKSETINIGYYKTVFENDIQTEVTTSMRSSMFRITFPKGENNNLLVDCGFYLGENPIPDAREAQQFVGAEVELVSDREICGYTRIRGGWNNGRAYTVYFCLQSDVPFKEKKTWRKDSVEHISDKAYRADKGNKVGALVSFDSEEVNIRIGISFVGIVKARENICQDDFDTQHQKLLSAWDDLFKRIRIEGDDFRKRLFYTGLYHTMLMPVDRNGENPLWTDTPYYDDYYALWDTYRTSMPLITILDEQRLADLVNSLLNIYRRDGFLPDARSGNDNGRTQGGSNAEVVIADAFVKNVKGIDYDLALKAMLKDAEVPPGGNEEKEGRGGLIAYNQLGYVPYGIDRAGTRTIEYAYDDYCIAQVAKGLGRTDVYERYVRQSDNWKNLWRSDYTYDGMTGYIMPRDEKGRWLDSVPWGHSKVYHPTIKYTPTTKVTPWHIPWWSTFFYEANSGEYSLSIPHDVKGLIEICGGDEKFAERLDVFFDKKYYNVANEPSFLTPCLYHWMGRPDLSSDRVLKIIRENYDDSVSGLPGNDDSGAMSSWLAFHMLGIYPNAGQNYYLLHTPMVDEYTVLLCNGKTLHATVEGKGEHFDDALLNGKTVEGAFLLHEQLMEGGELVFKVSDKKNVFGINNDKWSKKKMKKSSADKTKRKDTVDRYGHLTPFASYDFAYTLNRQYRTWPVTMSDDGDTLHVKCKEAVYRIPKKVADEADGFCWNIPSDGTVYNNVSGTFGFISRKAFEKLKNDGSFVYDGITWRKVDGDTVSSVIHVMADLDRTELWISTEDILPMVLEMRNNPLGIDWKTIKH